jgi:hypothetical protein
MSLPPGVRVLLACPRRRSGSGRQGLFWEAPKCRGVSPRSSARVVLNLDSGPLNGTRTIGSARPRDAEADPAVNRAAGVVYEIEGR